MLFKKFQPPIIVVVANGRWDCFGPRTRRSARLAARLHDKGGVNETVPDGTYQYNVKWEGLKLVELLLPIED